MSKNVFIPAVLTVGILAVASFFYVIVNESSGQKKTYESPPTIWTNYKPEPIKNSPPTTQQPQETQRETAPYPRVFYTQNEILVSKLQGIWTIIETTNRGKNVDDLVGTKWIFKGQEFYPLKKPDYRFIFHVDATKDPIQIDISMKISKKLTITHKGILRFDEDDLKITFGTLERPKHFNPSTDQEFTQSVYERDD